MDFWWTHSAPPPCVDQSRKSARIERRTLSQWISVSTKNPHSRVTLDSRVLLWRLKPLSLDVPWPSVIYKFREVEFPWFLFSDKEDHITEKMKHRVKAPERLSITPVVEPLTKYKFPADLKQARSAKVSTPAIWKSLLDILWFWKQWVHCYFFSEWREISCEINEG